MLRLGWLAAALLVGLMLALAAPANDIAAKKDKGGDSGKGDKVRPTSVTFRYHAFGNGSPVSLTFDEQKDGQSFDKSSVSDGETFTVTTGQQTGVDMLLGSYNIDVHTSCSAPIGVGMVFNDDIEKPAPDAPSMAGYTGPTALEIVALDPPNACNNVAPSPTPTSTPTATATPTATMTCPGGGTMPPGGSHCPSPTPTPTEPPTPTPTATPTEPPTPTPTPSPTPTQTPCTCATPTPTTPPTPTPTTPPTPTPTTPPTPTPTTPPTPTPSPTPTICTCPTPTPSATATPTPTAPPTPTPTAPPTPTPTAPPTPTPTAPPTPTPTAPPTPTPTLCPCPTPTLPPPPSATPNMETCLTSHSGLTMLVIGGNALDQLGSTGSGSFSQGAVTISISNFDGFAFDWSSNWVISSVFVRIADGGELFTYDPPAQSRSDVSAGDEITHLSFCYSPPQPSTPPTPTPTTPPTPTPCACPTPTMTYPPTHKPTPTPPDTTFVFDRAGGAGPGGLLIALLLISLAAAGLVLSTSRRTAAVASATLGFWSTSSPSRPAGPAGRQAPWSSRRR